ncbi:hypothetical protein [Salipiger mucosus]|uniref:Uncharacterized protein n=1 Tax=Salipiger mucosus DSM 16094 TaxID=1123237 RepID=S9QYQ7_9RHOB|nr:hypothetical protein [Salipiger mucosus]EPX84783.1 hypothetical protein Salmuc_01356 [Salipiger mucosus DSM 16094]
MSHPSAAPGQLKIKHGKREGDLFFCHGPGTAKADVHLLLGALTERVCEPDFGARYRMELDGQMADSILAQLEARGYDPTTLEISIRKKEEVPDHGHS